MRLVYVFKKITTPTGEYEEGLDGFMVHKMDKWEGWMLEARLSDFGGQSILKEIERRYKSVKIRRVETGVSYGVPDDYRNPEYKSSDRIIDMLTRSFRKQDDSQMEDDNYGQ